MLKKCKWIAKEIISLENCSLFAIVVAFTDEKPNDEHKKKKIKSKLKEKREKIPKDKKSNQKKI